MKTKQNDSMPVRRPSRGLSRSISMNPPHADGSNLYIYFVGAGVTLLQAKHWIGGNEPQSDTHQLQHGWIQNERID